MADGPQWKPRKWNDPSTIVALIVLLLGGTLVVVDGLDEVWFGRAVTFGYWPYILLGMVGAWFFGIRLWRVGGGPDGGV